MYRPSLVLSTNLHCMIQEGYGNETTSIRSVICQSLSQIYNYIYMYIHVHVYGFFFYIRTKDFPKL